MKINVKGWEVNVSSQIVVIPPEIVDFLSKKIEEFVQSFDGEEGTWVYKEFGVPSIILRVDGCLTPEPFIFEVEERPAGIGFAYHINSQFRSLLNNLLNEFPSKSDISVVISPLRKGGDDHLWLREEQVKVYPLGMNSSGFFLVRGEPEELWIGEFLSQSLSTIFRKGDKMPLVKMGLAYEVTDSDKLPWEKGFVLKPRQGSKSKGIEIWDPQKRRGASTRSRIEKILKGKRGYVWQPLVVPPPPPSWPENWFSILRLFWGYLPTKRQWVPLGGLWNARPNLRVHGASDAIFGPGLVY